MSAYKAGIVLLNPRAIPTVEQNITHLGVPVIRLRGLTEHQIAYDGHWQTMIAGAKARGFTHLIVHADDCLLPPHTLTSIITRSRHWPDYVFTGWANLDLGGHQVNLSDQPLPPEPTVEGFPTPVWRDVLAGPIERRTWFAGFTATIAPIGVWERFPYETHGPPPGCCADFTFSRRLQEARISITAIREAFVPHLKEQWGRNDRHPEKRLLIGKLEPGVVFPC